MNVYFTPCCLHYCDVLKEPKVCEPMKEKHILAQMRINIKKKKQLYVHVAMP